MLFRRRDKINLYRKAKEAVVPQKGWKRPFQYIALRLKRRPGTPEFIAKGFAIGMLLNFTPFIGIHFVGAIVLAWMLRADIIAAVLASLLINAPVTFGVIFPLTYRVGKAVMGLKPRYAEASLDTFKELFDKLFTIESWAEFKHVLLELFIPMTIGGFLLGFPAAFASYYLVKKTIQVFKKQRDAIVRHRLVKQFEQVEAEIEQDNPHIRHD